MDTEEASCERTMKCYSLGGFHRQCFIGGILGSVGNRGGGSRVVAGRSCGWVTRVGLLREERTRWCRGSSLVGLDVSLPLFFITMALVVLILKHDRGKLLHYVVPETGIGIGWRTASGSHLFWLNVKVAEVNRMVGGLDEMLARFLGKSNFTYSLRVVLIYAVIPSF